MPVMCAGCDGLERSSLRLSQHEDKYLSMVYTSIGTGGKPSHCGVSINASNSRTWFVFPSIPAQLSSSHHLSHSILLDLTTLLVQKRLLSAKPSTAMSTKDFAALKPVISRECVVTTRHDAQKSPTPYMY